MSEEYRQLEAQLAKIRERRARMSQTVIEMRALMSVFEDIIRDADADIMAADLQIKAMRALGDNRGKTEDESKG